VVGVGFFGAASSGGLKGGASGAISLSPPVVVGGSVGVSAVGAVSGGVNLTNYSSPRQLGKFWAFGANPADWALFGARQLCK
jgi:hypothetical protein